MFLFYQMREKKVLILKSSSILFGLFVAVCTIYFAHILVIPTPDTFDPAATCLKPPLDCWDGYSKPHYKCMTYDKDTVIRNGVIVPSGTVNCYKSIYFNIDSTALYMFIWMSIWTTVTSRAFESILFNALKRTLRVPMAVAISLSVPSVWYVCSVLVHYLNDRYFPMYYSQLFFTMTELFSTIVCILHLNNQGNIYKKLLIGMISISIFHILELFLDEPFFVSSHIAGTIRNLLFLIGDICVAYAGCSLLKINTQNVRSVLLCILALGVVFHTFCADEASFNLQRKK